MDLNELKHKIGEINVSHVQKRGMRNVEVERELFFSYFRIFT